MKECPYFEYFRFINSQLWCFSMSINGRTRTSTRTYNMCHSTTHNMVLSAFAEAGKIQQYWLIPCGFCWPTVTWSDELILCRLNSSRRFSLVSCCWTENWLSSSLTYYCSHYWLVLTTCATKWEPMYDAMEMGQLLLLQSTEVNLVETHSDYVHSLSFVISNENSLWEITQQVSVILSTR